ncbi:hypothetical protein QT970_26430 [Microcoleus sp. herbarium8]|uniref:hypothetical protein n=1 Tax=Microcoleus sp. herbarium8 TaxID=3055436 RepID=UPI002FD261D4
MYKITLKVVDRALVKTKEKPIGYIETNLNRGAPNRIFDRKTQETINRVCSHNKRVTIAIEGDRKKCQN